MILGLDICVPRDIVADITRVVQAIAFGNIDGGDCYARCAIGDYVLHQLGWEPDVTIGGLLYRAGPDPLRDIVAFCGPNNHGMMLGGRFLGHLWLKVHGATVDFTPLDWRRLYRPRGGLGSVVWQYAPPSLIWAAADVFGWQSQGAPEPGQLWYCPWTGDYPPLYCDHRRFTDVADKFAPLLRKKLTGFSLAERVADWRQAPQIYRTKWAHLLRAEKSRVSNQ